MRQLLSLSCRTTPDSLTHLIKYLMQTMFHAWLSACAVCLSLCVCVCERESVVEQLLIRAIYRQKIAVHPLTLTHTHRWGLQSSAGSAHCRGQWAFVGQCIVGIVRHKGHKERGRKSKKIRGKNCVSVTDVKRQKKCTCKPCVALQFNFYYLFKFFIVVSTIITGKWALAKKILKLRLTLTMLKRYVRRNK